jgi:hypothetical protein
MRILRGSVRHACCLPLCMLVLYAGSYALWSRCWAWRSGRLWSFYQPPAGLVSFELKARYRSPGVTPWEGWQSWEGYPAALFRPFIWVDEALNGSRYLPEYEGAVCFN